MYYIKQLKDVIIIIVKNGIYWLFLLPLSIFLGVLFGAMMFFCISCFAGTFIGGIFFCMSLIFSVIYTVKIWFFT